MNSNKIFTVYNDCRCNKRNTVNTTKAIKFELDYESNLIQLLLKNLSAYFWNRFSVSGGYGRMIRKKQHIRK